MSLLVASACRTAPHAPLERDFRLVGASPRLLVAGAETTVPVTLIDAGTLEWRPGRVHLSYHWLWLVPRELAHPSRALPFHEGIRTELPTRIAPGQSLALRGRILAPPWPGLYWLQWDVVDEGVTWFAQVAPPQPRRLVLVVPPLAWMLAPLPLAIVIAGLVGRPRRAVAAADAWWCAAVLFAKPVVLYHDAVLEPTAVAYWLTAIVAILVPVLAAAALPRRARIVVLTAVSVVATLVVVSDVVYYRFFGDVLSAPALLAARQTGRVAETIGSLLSRDVVWLIADVPFGCVLAVVLLRSVASVRRAPIQRGVIAAGGLAAAAAGTLLTSAPRVLARADLDQMFRNRAVVEQLGAFGFHAYDGWTYARATWFRREATAGEVDAAYHWFADRAPLRAGAGPRFGAARGLNLIVVQVESLQDFAVDYAVNGQEVMPHLRRWPADALRFSTVTDQTSEGRTSDAEFTSLVSLLPIEHGAAAFRYAGNHYVGLPRILREHGYHTLSAVPFEPGFWNRDIMHPVYGFERTLFESDFALTEQIGWGLDDRDFFEQMVPHLERLQRPFCAWLITLSLHHPFDNFPDRHKVMKLGSLEGTSFGNYLHTMRFFDDALTQFMATLQTRGLLDDSVVVVFGDHDAGFPPDVELARTIGIRADRASWAAADRVPWFVRVPRGGEVDGLHGDDDRPAGQTDMAPTLLALLGIDPEPLPYVGRNLLGAPDDPPVLRPYGDWIDSRHAFLTHAAGTEPACYDRLRSAAIERTACADANAAARAAREVSAVVVADDLQERLRERLRDVSR